MGRMGGLWKGFPRELGMRSGTGRLEALSSRLSGHA